MGNNRVAQLCTRQNRITDIIIGAPRAKREQRPKMCVWLFIKRKIVHRGVMYEKTVCKSVSSISNKRPKTLSTCRIKYRLGMTFDFERHVMFNLHRYTTHLL